MRMKREDMQAAVKAGLLAESQAEPLWTFLAERSPLQWRTVVTYAGALLMITALSVFFVTGWAAWGGGGVLSLSALYIGALVVFSEYVGRMEGMGTARGILLTTAVCIVPLAIYGVQESLGLWQGNNPGNYVEFHKWVRSGWLWMELGTIAAALAALRRFRFPFLMFPVAVVLWYLSMDLTPLLFGADFSWLLRRRVSVAFGAVLLGVAYGVDWRWKEDFAFWLYLAGLAAFWGGLTSMDSGSEAGRFVYGLINAALLALGVVLQRRAFLAFGAAGLFLYLGHLAWDVFKDVVLFTVFLSALGFALIVLAIRSQKRAAGLAALRERWVPPGLARWMPPRR